jgi:hypothetical protein
MVLAKDGTTTSKYFLLLLAAVVTAGCAGPRIVEMSPDTYMVSLTGHGIFSSIPNLKADAMDAAHKFAEKQGKVSIPLASSEHPFMMGGPNPWVELQFRVVDKNDPEARRTHLVQNPDVLIKKEELIVGDVRTKVETEKPDLLAKLQKLGDLRKQGILSEDEFQEQKKKLLQENR